MPLKWNQNIPKSVPIIRHVPRPMLESQNWLLYAYSHIFCCLCPPSRQLHLHFWCGYFLSVFVWDEAWFFMIFILLIFINWMLHTVAELRTAVFSKVALRTIRLVSRKVCSFNGFICRFIIPSGMPDKEKCFHYICLW